MTPSDVALVTHARRRRTGRQHATVPFRAENSMCGKRTCNATPIINGRGCSYSTIPTPPTLPHFMRAVVLPVSHYTLRLPKNGHFSTYCFAAATYCAMRAVLVWTTTTCQQRLRLPPHHAFHCLPRLPALPVLPSSSSRAPCLPAIPLPPAAPLASLLYRQTTCFLLSLCAQHSQPSLPTCPACLHAAAGSGSRARLQPATSKPGGHAAAVPLPSVSDGVGETNIRGCQDGRRGRHSMPTGAP